MSSLDPYEERVPNHHFGTRMEGIGIAYQAGPKVY